MVKPTKMPTRGSPVTSVSTGAEALAGAVLLLVLLGVVGLLLCSPL